MPFGVGKNKIGWFGSGGSGSGVSSVGGGTSIVYTSNQIKSLVQGTGIVITDNGTTVTIAATGDNITVVANYSALPDPTTVSEQFFWVSNSQGTKWLPGTLGGTYYSAGLYYSNGVSWEVMDVPYQASQAAVNTGTVTDQFVTPSTLKNSAQWATKVDANPLIVGATKSKITFDSKGLVTAGDDLTHNELVGLQGGTTNEYYHLTSSEYTGTGTGVFVRRNSPDLTGVPTAPTATTGTNTFQLATTQFVQSAVSALVTGVSSVSGTSNRISVSPTTGNVVVDISVTYVGQTSITTVGTITTGTWSGLFGSVSGANLTNLTAANISAGTAGISITGNSATATALQTPRTINGVSFDGTANITVTAAAGTLTGTTLNATVVNSSLTSVGTLVNLTVTNTIVGSITGNAATVTTNANLTGPITSVGNATSVASQTGTGSTFVMDTGPTMTNPLVGTQAASDNSQKAASTAYVTSAINTAIAGVNPAVSVSAATTSASDTSSYTYNNGASGIGATLTGPVNTPLTVDGFTFTTLGQRLLVKNDTQAPSGAYNGVYYVTQLQTALLPVILTRALDYNQPSDINSTGAVPVVSGTVNADTSWILTSAVNTVGTDPLTYTQFTYSVAQLDARYFQIANNLSEGVAATMRSNLGLGALAVLSVATTAVGGTGITSYTTGDLLYASGATTLSKLADVAAGSYLRSGGVGTAPVWSTVTLPNSATTGDIIFASASNVYSNLADIATGSVLISGGIGVAPSWSASPTLTTSLTTPLLIGGTAAGSNLTYKSTTGTGTATGLAHQFVGGTNGGTTIASLYNDGQFLVGTTTRNTTALGVVRIAQGTSTVDIGEVSAGIGAIWLNSSTPTTTNYTLKSTAAVTLLNGTTNVQLAVNNVAKIVANATAITFDTSIASSGNATPFTFTAPASTNQTASVEVSGFSYSLTTSRQWGTGALTLQREWLISTPTYRFVGASTISDAVTFEVSGAPVAGTNATITRSWAGRFIGNLYADKLFAGATGISPTAFIDAAASTTGAASARIRSGTAPTSPNDGDIWNDSTSKNLTLNIAGLNQRIIADIFTQTADKTFSNTTTETSLVGTGTGTVTLPANFWTVGKSVTLDVIGIFSRTSGNFTFKVKLGATTIDTSETQSPGSATNMVWFGKVYITCRSTGATGTVMSSGYVYIPQNAAANQFSFANTTTTTIDTTASQLLDFTGQTSTANAGNSITSQILTVKVL